MSTVSPILASRARRTGSPVPAEPGRGRVWKNGARLDEVVIPGGGGATAPCIRPSVPDVASDWLETLVDWTAPAAYLGLKKGAFGTLVRNSDMPHFKINARVFRFRLSDVIRWSEAKRKGGRFIR
jgi:hypothetical protein